MPKLKTHKGAKKRFKLTGTHKVFRNKAYKSHILTKKSAKRKRSLRKKGIVDAFDMSRIRRLLPYDF
ncbi:MAG: 50S ribosomal protein L35 [Candidatus Aminicenantes bacterium]|nr:50S ribosomal protein L35 [Candidatus Aminicenantes bacterium]